MRCVRNLTKFEERWLKNYLSLWSFVSKLPEERQYLLWEKEVRERVQKEIENEKNSSKEKE